ncbi:hypothetical protein GCM10020255_068040 [Rhodococcus baikonurensis]
MTGYLHGDLFDEAGSAELVRTAQLCLAPAAKLGVPRLNFHTGELVDGQAARPQYRTTGAMWLTAQRALEKIAQLGEDAGVVFCLETSIRSSITPEYRWPAPKTLWHWWNPSHIQTSR